MAHDPAAAAAEEMALAIEEPVQARLFVRRLLGLDGVASEGNLAEVQRLIRTGAAGVTDRDEFGMTALLYAAVGGHLHAVQWLLREGGSSINERSDAGETVLHFAAISRNQDMLRWLVQEGGADLHARDYDGRTVLMSAMLFFHAASVQFLLREHGADITDVDHQGMDVWAHLKDSLWRRKMDADSAEQWLRPVEIADVYSVLRCYGSPADPTAFIAGLERLEGRHDGRFINGPLPAAHRELLLQTERAHASPNLLPYRAQRLALLHEGSDFARIVYPDLQNIVAEYAQPTADAQLSAAVIAEADEADEHARVYGRNVRRRVACRSFCVVS
jgi:hypothetical protein